jgi:hypothetical protein
MTDAILSHLSLLADWPAYTWWKLFLWVLYEVFTHPVSVLYIATCVFFWLYIAVMKLRDVRDSTGLTLAHKLLGYPALLIGFPLDIVYNHIIGTIVFVQLPKGLGDTLSARAKRANRSLPSTALGRYRKKAGTWLLKQVAPFDSTGWHNPV